MKNSNMHIVMKKSWLTCSLALTMTSCSERAPPPHATMAPRSVPQQLEPEQDAALPNRSDAAIGESLRWKFAWVEVPGAARYEIQIHHFDRVLHKSRPPGGTRFPIEVQPALVESMAMFDEEVTDPVFCLARSERTAELANWAWRVRASVDGKWRDWTDWSHFYVETTGIEELKEQIAIIRDSAAPTVDRQRAIESLGTLGPSAKVAATALAEALGNPELRNSALAAIVRLRTEARPALSEIVRQLREPEGALPAAMALRTLGPAARPVARELTAVVEDSQCDPMVRILAAGALVNSGGDCRPAMPFLIDRLRHGSTGLHKLAATGVLREAGPDASDAVPALVEVLTNEAPAGDICNNAAIALGNIGPAARAAEPALRTIIKRGGDVVNFEQALQQITGSQPTNPKRRRNGSGEDSSR